MKRFISAAAKGVRQDLSSNMSKARPIREIECPVRRLAARIDAPAVLLPAFAGLSLSACGT
jgi:hypothetical protein